MADNEVASTPEETGLTPEELAGWDEFIQQAGVEEVLPVATSADQLGGTAPAPDPLGDPEPFVSDWPPPADWGVEFGQAEMLPDPTVPETGFAPDAASSLQAPVPGVGGAQGAPPPDGGVDAVSGGLTAPQQAQVAADDAAAAGYRTLRDVEGPVQLAEEQAAREFDAQQARDKAYTDAYLQHQEATARERAAAEGALLKYQERMARLDQEWQELVQNGAPDPDHWWANADTGQKLGAAMSAVFGGMLAAFQGRNPATAMQPIFDLIDRDIQSQRDAMFGAREGLTMRRGIARDLYEAHGDAERAAQAARLASLAHLDSYLAARQRMYDPAGTRAMMVEQARQATRAKMLEAGQQAQAALLKNQMDMARLEIDAMRARKEMAELQMKMVKSGKGKAPTIGTYGPEADPLAMFEVYELGADGQQIDVRAKSEKDYGEWQKIASGGKLVWNTLQTLYELRDQADAEGMPGELSSKWLGTPLGRRIEQRHSALFSAMRKLEGTGANLTEEEIRRITKQIGDSGGTWASYKQAWMELEAHLYERMSIEAQAASGRPAIWRPSRVGAAVKRKAVEGDVAVPEAARAGRLIDTVQPRVSLEGAVTRTLEKAKVPTPRDPEMVEYDKMVEAGYEPFYVKGKYKWRKRK